MVSIDRRVMLDFAKFNGGVVALLSALIAAGEQVQNFMVKEVIWFGILIALVEIAAVWTILKLLWA